MRAALAMSLPEAVECPLPGRARDPGGCLERRERIAAVAEFRLDHSQEQQGDAVGAVQADGLVEPCPRLGEAGGAGLAPRAHGPRYRDPPEHELRGTFQPPRDPIPFLSLVADWPMESRQVLQGVPRRDFGLVEKAL